MSETPEELLYTLALSSLPGFGSATVRRLLLKRVADDERIVVASDDRERAPIQPMHDLFAHGVGQQRGESPAGEDNQVAESIARDSALPTTSESTAASTSTLTSANEPSGSHAAGQADEFAAAPATTHATTPVTTPATTPATSPATAAANTSSRADNARRTFLRAARGADDAAAALRAAEELLARCASLGVQVVCIGDERYPEALLDLEDPPSILYALGDLALARPAAVALVGSRRATPYGRDVVRGLAGELAARGVCVISGLAAGIDAEAHAATLGGGGLTIAVQGTGVNVPYPRANSDLHAQIVRRGLVLSELPPGAPAHPGAFPRRNRIIAALADVIVVVEAGVKSGALITATLGDTIGRRIAAVPGPVDVESSMGANRLLRDGAHVVTSSDDLLALLALTTRGRAHQTQLRQSLSDSIPPVLSATPSARLSATPAAGRSTTIDNSFRGDVGAQRGDVDDRPFSETVGVRRSAPADSSFGASADRSITRDLGARFIATADPLRRKPSDALVGASHEATSRSHDGRTSRVASPTERTHPAFVPPHAKDSPEGRVLSLLRVGAQGPDELLRACALSPRQICVALATLQLSNSVIIDPSGLVRLDPRFVGFAE